MVPITLVGFVSSPLSLSLFPSSSSPTNNALLINFLLSSDAEILLIITDWACKSAPNVQKRVCNAYVSRLSFHFAYHPWWLGPPPFPAVSELVNWDGGGKVANPLLSFCPPKKFAWDLKHYRALQYSQTWTTGRWRWPNFLPFCDNPNQPQRPLPLNPKLRNDCQLSQLFGARFSPNFVNKCRTWTKTRARCVPPLLVGKALLVPEFPTTNGARRASLLVCATVIQGGPIKEWQFYLKFDLFPFSDPIQFVGVEGGEVRQSLSIYSALSTVHAIKSFLFCLPLFVKITATQPSVVACKKEAQLEHVHIAYTFLRVWRRLVMLRQCLLTKISAAELRKKFFKSALLVGFDCTMEE